MIGDKTLMMVKGPSRFGANLGLEMDHLRFLASNQTLSPLVKGVKLWLLCEDMTWWMSSWAVRALSWAATRDLRWASTVGMEDSEIKEGRARGSYPIMR